MINKKHFGKRVADFRRKLGLSQAELAEKLGISAQAVSKWETGAALPDIELLLELSGRFSISVNELLEDNSLIARLANRGFEARDGIAYFVPPMTEPEWIEWEQEMQKGSWVARNWRDAWNKRGGWADFGREKSVLAERDKPGNLRIGKKVAERGGIILEIGAGPGGGYMPFILQADPAAQIIVSDLSHTVVKEWKRFLEKEVDSPHLCFAALDFCDIPFGDCTVDVVCDHGAVINCIGDRSVALKEIYRVLKPGGIYVSLNGFVTKKVRNTLPKEAREAIQQEYPEVFDDLYEDTVLAGFRKIDSTVEGAWTTTEDESGVAKLAEELGIVLEFTEYVRFCEK